MGDDDPNVEIEEAATAVRPQQGGAATTGYSLTVVHGPDAGVSTTVDATLPTPVLVGQSPACGLRLSDREVSRRHVELYVTDGRLHLRDLGSTNGTFVQDVSVIEASLGGGETLRLGSTALRVDRVTAAGAPPPRATQLGRFVGSSLEVQRLYPLVERLAWSTVPVVIEGETGTGKEVLAEAMHDASQRAAGPYVVFDCTAVPASLVEAELFGHERGAFTGAVAARKGVFEQAHGGTLLIDEIGDLELALQPKLLRAIERSEIRRIGGDRSIRVDVRILAATRRDLDQEVARGRFRDDLFHRLSVARVELPPLRRRRGDVETLARFFWTQLGGGELPLPEELLARWRDDPWPGNVRELRNAVARVLALGDLASVYPASSREGVRSVPPPSPSQPSPGADVIAAVVAQHLPLPVARLKVVEELERRYVTQALDEHDGNVGRASAALGITRRYFQMVRGRVNKG